MKVKRKNQGFTLIELLVVIAIIAILVVVYIPWRGCRVESARMTTDVNKIKNILIACDSFAADWDGLYPSFDPDDLSRGEDAKFSTSTEAFNVLIPQYIDQESTFWIQTKNPDKLKPPNEDGELTRNENTYAYVTGQTNTSYSGSPLVADGEMERPGVYGKYHPWLAEKIAIVGYVGGHVAKERLTSSEPGATIKAREVSEDIYSKREPDKGDGKLDIDPSNILLP